MERKALGRRKIEIKKIERENNLQVTFTKRRGGVFKKASEICTLCGVQICIIIFSPAMKVYSFGHPSVKELVRRFYEQHPQPPPSTGDQIMDTSELTTELTKALEKLEIAKNESKKLENIKLSMEAEKWWAKPLKDMDPTQLEQMRLLLEELRRKVDIEKQKLLSQFTLDASSQFHAGSSSRLADPFDGGNPQYFETEVQPNNNGFGPEFEPDLGFENNGFGPEFEPDLGFENHGFGCKIQKHLDFQIEAQPSYDFEADVEFNRGYGSETYPNHDFENEAQLNN